jgi:Flp pilus assembly protein TadB
MSYLATKFLGLARGWWLLAVAALATALGLWLIAAERADDQANRRIGAAEQRQADLTATLERTEEAHAARAEIRDQDHGRSPARYDQCLRTARTPANCERFLPGGAADHR